MKNKETLEEFIKEVLEDEFFTNISEYKKAERLIEIGAKWQAERMYSEQQLRDAYSSALDFGYMSATRYEEPDNDEKFEEWFLLSYPKAEP